MAETKAIIPPCLSLEEFLSVLVAIVVKRRLNAPQRSGCAEDAFSRAFARVGHWGGGSAFIRSADPDDPHCESGPICEAARFLLGKKFKPEQWREAAMAIGLTRRIAERIQNACELSPKRDSKLYRRILEACSLPRNKDDSKDLET